MIRTGIGYDVHRFCKGRRLILGGIEIPFTEGLAGHSDADVLLHAMCDAMLGGIGEGDIGQHFPDYDMRFKDISSMKLLEDVAGLLERKGFILLNIDSTIIAERPRVSGFVMGMRENISGLLGLDIGCVNIKATTNEGLGFIGRGEGIAAQAVCTVRKVGPA
jgi:2-C-methyl-D-erythritol 2,4-cyclodiphosphate synthase